MSDTKLTLEDRSKFESLLAEYANAEMDCVRASGRRHDAMHRVLDYVNAHVGIHVACAYQRGLMEGTAAPDVVPTGTTEFEREGAKVVMQAKGIYAACTADEIANGVYHSNGPWVPVKNCSCRTCVEHRAAALLPPALLDDELPHPLGALDPAQR